MYGFSTTLFFSKTSFLANTSRNIAVSCLFRDQSLYPWAPTALWSWNVMINFIFMWVFLNGVSLFTVVGKLKMHGNVSELDVFSFKPNNRIPWKWHLFNYFPLEASLPTDHAFANCKTTALLSVQMFQMFTVYHHRNMFYLLNMYLPSSKATSAASLTIASESTEKQSVCPERTVLRCWDSQLMA